MKQPDASLHVIDVHSPPAAKEHPRCSIPDHVLARLDSVDWSGSGGDVGSSWHLEVGRRFFSYACALPGTAGSPASRTPPSVPVGISFDLSARRGTVPEKPCMVACLVWAALSDHVWNNVVETLRQKAISLSSVYCFQEPEMPNGPPCLVSLRTGTWRNLSPDQQLELYELLPPIGWSAINALF
jgi:hypothetical protein